MADKVSELAYYYALYHQVAHWAAFVATIGLLLNTGFMLGTSARSMSKQKCNLCRAFIAVSLLGSWFFILRMFQYGEVVKRYIPSDYLHQISPNVILNPTPVIALLGALAALDIAIGDWILIAPENVKVSVSSETHDQANAAPIA